MASIATPTRITPCQPYRLQNSAFRARVLLTTRNAFGWRGQLGKGLNPSHYPRVIYPTFVTKPIRAVGSGLEASITDPEDDRMIIKEAQTLVESQDENAIRLRVDLPGKETEKIFSKVLTNLARTAPPVPGFRREKGGKTSKIPRDFLLQILGEDRVTKFVIQEIVTSTIADYVQKEGLKVKDKKTNTIEKAEELKKAFSPGKEFGFSAVLELEKSESQPPSSNPS